MNQAPRGPGGVLRLNGYAREQLWETPALRPGREALGPCQGNSFARRFPPLGRYARIEIEYAGLSHLFASRPYSAVRNSRLLRSGVLARSHVPWQAPARVCACGGPSSGGCAAQDGAAATFAPRGSPPHGSPGRAVHGGLAWGRVRQTPTDRDTVAFRYATQGQESPPGRDSRGRSPGPSFCARRTLQRRLTTETRRTRAEKDEGSQMRDIGMSDQDQSSPVIPDLSSLIPHLSSLISHPHPSSLIPHLSSLISHPSSLIPHLSSLIPHPSSLIPHLSSLIPHL